MMIFSTASSSSRILQLACVVAAAIGLSSCKSTQSGSGSPYASSEGGYNPYPSGGGVAQNGSLLASGSQPKYAEAPPPPPPGYDGPSGDFQEMPKKRSTSSGSGTSSKTKSKSSGSTASSSGKKKGSSSAGITKGGYTFSGGNVHIVKAGDTLYAIADHNHTTVAKLKALNHLKSNSLKVGQKIKVK